MKKTSDRRHFLKAAVAGALAGSLGPKQSSLFAQSSAHATSQKSSNPPDVVFISMDEVSTTRFGCYGNKICQTPNIDQLAGEGIRFDLAHCASPICVPSRTSLLLSLRPETTGCSVNSFDWTTELARQYRSMPRHFRDCGYETISIGKLFHNQNVVDTATEPFACWDRWIIPPDTDPPYESLRGPDKDSIDLMRKYYKETGHWGDLPFVYGPGPDEKNDGEGICADRAINAIRNQWGPGDRPPEAEGVCSAGQCTDRAIQVLREKRDKPLFLGIGFKRPHNPYVCPEKYFNRYTPNAVTIPVNPPNDTDDTWIGPVPDHGPGRFPAFNCSWRSRALPDFDPKQDFITTQHWHEALAAHYACITYLDSLIGRILDALREAGRSENTIVALWADHGGMLGEHFWWFKCSMFEESVTVPLIIKAPAHIRPGTVCKRPVESVDIFPTLFDLCGLPQPPHIDGISMVPLLRDPTRNWRKGAISRFGGSSGKRLEPAATIRTDRWRYIERKTLGLAELYDHDNDPREFTNLANSSEHARTVADLSRLLNAPWQELLP